MDSYVPLTAEKLIFDCNLHNLFSFDWIILKLVNKVDMYEGCSK